MTQKIEMTKEELNKEYFVRGLVPEWDSKIKEFAKTSQQKRKEATNDFEKDLFKLMNLSLIHISEPTRPY